MKRRDLAWLQELASAKGGSCLSTEYINARAKYIWRCSKGHEWMAIADSVSRGSWCLVCSGSKRKTLDWLKELAHKKEGTCLSSFYVNNRTKYTWRCKDGHEWVAAARDVQQNKWCLVCSGKKRKDLDWLRELALKKDGVCLSTTYINNHTKCTWQCAKGHEWLAAPSDIQQGQWCPDCSGNKIKTLDWLRELVSDKGFCLSTVYINSATKYTWKCLKGHIWHATANKIQQGYWCPHCSNRTSTQERALFAKVKEVYPDALPNKRGLLKNKKLELDIWVPSLRKAIEFDGVFWHKSEWAVSHGAPERDASKDIQCQEANIQLLRIDEEDWESDQASVIIKVFEFLKLT